MFRNDKAHRDGDHTGKSAEQADEKHRNEEIEEHDKRVAARGAVADAGDLSDNVGRFRGRVAASVTTVGTL
jgi:hypothetical protein